MKRWEKAVNYKYLSQAAHTFLLYLDVADEILTDEKILTLPEYLTGETVVGESKFVAFFNRGSGIRFLDHKMEEQFLSFLRVLFPEKDQAGRNAAEATFRLNRNKIGYAIGLFNEMLRIAWDEKRPKVKEALQKCFESEVKKHSNKPFFTVVFEYVETIAPRNATNSSCEADRDAVVTFLVWAKDREIRTARNIVILTAESLSSIAAQLSSETAGIVPLKLHFPDLEDREKTYAFLRKQYKGLKDDLEAGRFAQLSAGMSRNAIISLVKETYFKKAPISPETLFNTKKKYIEEQSGGLLEVVQPLWGIKAIGGLEEHKKYILETVEAMRKKDILSVPMGVLLLGAPGTGKTVFAQAMAYEAQIPFVRLKNVREMWVGQSERNLDFALELIVAQEPVVVFMDEIDQEVQSRDAFQGDSGVNSRLQGRLFQIMSDTDLRGRVLWIAATNRPDNLDPAMLREGRFDDKIPFFPPFAKERAEILKAILHKMEVQAKAQKTVYPFEWQLKEEDIQEFGWLAHRHLVNNMARKCDPEMHPRAKEQDDEIPITGAQIERVLQAAYKLASEKKEAVKKKHLLDALNDYIPPQTASEYKRLTALAIFFCNSERFIPERWKKEAERVRATAGQSSEGTRIKL